VDDRITSLLTGGQCLIDLGCGDGQFLDDIGDRYETAIGIDIGTTRRPRRSGVQGQWIYILADLDDSIPVRSWCAEVVHANQVIEHIRNPLALVVEAHRVLKSGGVLLMTTPNVRYLVHIWRLLVRGWGPITSDLGKRTLTDWDDGHIHFLTSIDLEWIAREAGFSHARTTALIGRTGRLRQLRRMLGRISGFRLVKSFLSGNILLIAIKE
jgi:SAM-dependent methyltransferase